jgi:peptidoglycan/LPS O-acetylase OafA/YrhL
MNYLGMISYPLFFCIAFIPESIIQFGFPYMFLDEGLTAEFIYCLSSIVLSLALASLIYFTISKPLQVLEANQ